MGNWSECNHLYMGNGIKCKNKIKRGRGERINASISAAWLHLVNLAILLI